MTSNVDYVVGSRRWYAKSTGLGSLLLMLLLFRAANALLCRSLFVPDEHWQSLEVAYNMVFNRGYLSWEWHSAIRGYTHPLVFAALYKGLVLFKLDTPNIMAESPRLLQSILAAVGDLYLYKLTKALFDSTTAKYTLLSYLFSWYTFYSCTRTLSNSTECSLLPVILYYCLMAIRKKHYLGNTFLYLSLSSLSFLIRPTGAIIFAPLFMYHLFFLRPFSHRAVLVGMALFVGLCSLLLGVLVDRCFYGQWVLTPLNFLKFNVLQGQSAMFGIHSWHWYFSQGLPTILYTSIPFFIHGVWLVLMDRCWSHAQLPFYLGVWLVIVHSFLKHKEFRFIQPFLPLSSVYVGVSLAKICLYKKEPTSLRTFTSHCPSWVLIKGISIALLLLNIPMSAYFCLVHQRGGYAVMDHLRYEHMDATNDDAKVLFLMPCHSTPQYSLFHSNATLLFLHCTYDWNESDYPFLEEHFYSDPISWVNENVIRASVPPSYLLMYDVLYGQIKSTLEPYFEMTSRIFHTHFRDNDRVGSYIVILKIKTDDKNEEQ